jgi:predicted ATP-dependent protease
VAKLIEHGSRLVADQGRLTSRLGDVLDLIRESAFWAGQPAHRSVRGEDVSHAIAS